MDDGSSSIIILSLSLLALHALIVLASGAISNARPAYMKTLAAEGNKRAQKVLRFGEQANRLRLTVLVLTSALQVAIATLVIALISMQPLTMPIWLAYVLTGATTVGLTLVFGELVPEAIGTLHADRMALWFVRPLHWMMIALTPITSVLTALGTVVSGLFGGADLVNLVTEEEILTLVDAGHTGGSIEDGEKEMIYSVLELDQTQASELMVPRVDIEGVEANTPLAELDMVFFESGYSRLPVYEKDIDDIKGIIIAKDLLMAYHNGNREKFKVALDLVRPALFVPETKTASELLKELRSSRNHIAIVVDEYGGTAGLISIEDLLEQIVGDIQDEYDDEEAEYTQMGENTWRMDASINIADVNDLLDVELSTVESDTIGGLIYTQLGRVPLPGEEVLLEPRVLVKVDKVEGRRIRQVTVRRVYPTTSTSEISKVSDDAAREDKPAENGDNPGSFAAKPGR